MRNSNADGIDAQPLRQKLDALAAYINAIAFKSTFVRIDGQGDGLGLGKFTLKLNSTIPRSRPRSNPLTE